MLNSSACFNRDENLVFTAPDTPPRVLIIEDDRPLTRLYSKVLLRGGCQVRTARSLAEAHELMERYPFDVCLCDVFVGDDVGLNMLGQLTLLDTDGTELIIISGWDQFRPLCEVFGVTFYLKPIPNDTLVKLVTDAARRKRTPADRTV